MDENKKQDPTTDPNTDQGNQGTDQVGGDEGAVTDTTGTDTTATETAPTPAPDADGATTPEPATGADGEPSNVTALVIGAIVVALLMIAGAWFIMGDSNRSVQQDPMTDGTMPADLDEGDPDEVVATVNGTELTRAEFNRIRQQVLQQAQQQPGVDLNDPEVMAQVNAQALDTLVNTELIRQAAVAAGVTVSGEQVDARFAEVVQSVGGAEALAESLQQLGITEESLRADVEQELVIQAYLDDSVDEEFSVTDEEVSDFYDELGGAEAGLPPLSEVREQIEQQLLATQENEVIEALLEGLRAEAQIETML